MGIDQIVNTVITPAQGSILQASFGTPLILSTEAAFAERLRYYTKLSALVDDGFATTGATYLLAQRMLGQSPRPRRVAVGRRANKPTQKFTLTPTAANSTLYSFKVTGGGKTVTVEYTSDASATVAEIVGGLVADFSTAVDPPAVGVTNVGPDLTVAVTASVAGAWFDVQVLTPRVLAIAQDNADAGVTADLTAILAEQPDWYGIATPFTGQAEVEAIAAFAESNEKLFGFSTVDSSNYDTAYDAGDVTPDVGTALKLASYARTFGLPAPSSGDFVAEGTLAYLLGTNPGSITLNLKRVAGATPMALTETQQANLRARNLNPYLSIAGVNGIISGIVALGEYVDVIRDRDWFVARLKERVFLVLQAAQKVPFTDEGIAIIRTEVEAMAQQGISVGFLAASPVPVVTAPKAADVSALDKAARTLPDVSLVATLAGAIHIVDPLNITISV